ncbi:metal ABC transporter substrate-binding protein [Rhodoferax sp.]|uniref:metal ABC transporter substrate-binding protein n=1 Tax=Rhodoferax sp. TaxID=50421 RepID=UPI00285213FE|nr:metal ABC transporter substrate-binding protein [Rhodoferax sp.]MDR3370761.1 metal ABC transporter substrate-binding protein [Rhodoferax sp.]
MTRLTLKWLACVALTTPLLLPTASHATEPLPVVASFSILGDLVKVVGGERVKVSTLVGPDADAHTFEPSPADAKTVLGARLLVINGLHFEPWAEKLAKSAGYKGGTLIASNGVKPRTMPAEEGQAEQNANGQQHDVDPHAWQDPRNVMLYIKNIAKSLSDLDPAGATSYQTNSTAYLKELQTLDADNQRQFAALSVHQRQVITSHDAFGYFGARYQIKFLAPQGVSTESEPSAKEVALLIRQIKKDYIRAVFMENMSNSQLLAQIAKDAGVTLGPKLYVDALSGPTEPGSTYLKLMHHNVTQLVARMKLN